MVVRQQFCRLGFNNNIIELPKHSSLHRVSFWIGGMLKWQTMLEGKIEHLPNVTNVLLLHDFYFLTHCHKLLNTNLQKSYIIYY